MQDITVHGLWNCFLRVISAGPISPWVEWGRALTNLSRNPTPRKRNVGEPVIPGGDIIDGAERSHLPSCTPKSMTLLLLLAR